MAFARTALIQASPEQVVSVLSNPARAQEWMPAIQRIENISSGLFGLGTQWQETRMAGKRTMQSTIRVVAFEPPTRLGLEVDAKALKGQLAFTLSPKDEGTEVRYEAEMQGRGLMRLMTGTINRMMAQEDSDILDRLRKQVEAGR